MAVILVTNDDGVHSPGIIALYRAMKTLGDAYIVAPDRERSAAGHSLTLHRPLKAEEIREHVYSINGTPTDCVTLGINKVLPERPSLVVSGINKGGNLGDDITYSGTVSAAVEGTIFGVPSLAFSLSTINTDAPWAASPSKPSRISFGNTPFSTIAEILASFNFGLHGPTVSASQFRKADRSSVG